MKKIFSIVVVLSMILILAGCGGNGNSVRETSKPPLPNSSQESVFNESSESQSNSSSEDTQKSEKLVLRMAAAVDFKNNPEAFTLVAESLIRKAPSGEVLPLIAQNWEINDTFTEFTLELTKDLKFNTGEPVGLEDYEKSLRVLGKVNYVGFADKLEEITMPNEHCLKITLSSPQLYFMQELVKVPIVKASAFDEDGVIKDYIGTGPYMLEKYVSDTSAYLVKNPNHIGIDSYAVDEIDWQVMFDGEARKLALISGQVDVIGISEHWPSVSFSQIHELMENTDMAYTQQDQEWYNIVKGVAFNWKTGPLSDLALRKALLYAVDREKMNQGLYFSKAHACGHYFNPMFEDGPKDEVEYVYDIAKAKEILKDAGYVLENGILTKDGNPVILRYVITNNPSFIDEAVFLQTEFKELGIETDIQTYEGKMIADEWEKGNFDITFNYGLFEPLITAIKFNGISSEFTRMGLGFGVNEKSIEAGKGVINAKNLEEVRKYSAQYWKELYQQIPYLPLYNSGRFAFFNKEWEGFYYTGYGDIDLSNVKKINN